MHAAHFVSMFALAAVVLATVPAHAGDARLRVRVTNKGEEVGARAIFVVYPPEERDNPIAEAEQGRQIALPPGRYDVAVRFDDGLISIEKWLKGLRLKGPVAKVVELGLSIADVKVAPTWRGRELHAQCRIYRTGERQSALVRVAWSSGEQRILAGKYDFGCVYKNETGVAERWVEKRSIKAGKQRVEVAFPDIPAGLTVAAPPGEPAPAPKRNVLVVLDTSKRTKAKTEGVTLLAGAAEAVADALQAHPDPKLNVAVRVAGAAPGHRKSCNEAPLLAPLGPLNHQALRTALGGIKPGGRAPIAVAIERAAEDLPANAHNTLLLVATGPDECKADPCAAAAKLEQRGLLTRSFVFHFGPVPDPGSSFACFGGQATAGSSMGLRRALKEALAEAQKPIAGTVALYPPGKRDRLVGLAVLGEMARVPAGHYDVVVRTGGRQVEWKDVKVHGSVRVEVSGAGPTPGNH